jgi:hypothetical protein
MSILRIFISYSSKNRDLVDVLANDLGAMGHVVWYDRNLIGAQEWWKAILENIRQCDVFVYALTPESLRSDACQKEYRYARDLGKTIIPVDLIGIDVTTLPRDLRKIQLNPYREQGKENALNLVKALNNREPGKAPAQPPLEPLPPSSPVGELFDRVNVQTPLSGQEQLEILDAIRQLFENDREKDWIHKISDLLDEMQQKHYQDLTYPAVHEINRLRSNIRAALRPDPTTISSRIRFPLKPNDQLSVLQDIESLFDNDQYGPTIPQLLTLLEDQQRDVVTIRASEKIRAIREKLKEHPQPTQPTSEIPTNEPVMVGSVDAPVAIGDSAQRRSPQGCRRQFQVTIGFTFVVILLLVFVLTSKPTNSDQFAANETSTANQVALGETATARIQPTHTPNVTLTVPILVTLRTLTPSTTLLIETPQARTSSASSTSARTSVASITNTKVPSPITAPTSTRTPTTVPPTLAPTPLPGTIQGFEAVSANGFKTVVQVIYTEACQRTPAQCQYVWIDSALVTNAQYSVCQQSNVCQLPVFSQEFYIPAHRSRLPVVGVNWGAANQYCKWRSERFPGPGRLPTRQERKGATLWIKDLADHVEWSATTAEGVDIALTPAPKQKMFVYADQARAQEEADRNLGFRCVLTIGTSASSK